jgi:hypothetical protein
MNVLNIKPPMSNYVTRMTTHCIACVEIPAGGDESSTVITGFFFANAVFSFSRLQQRVPVTSTNTTLQSNFEREKENVLTSSATFPVPSDSPALVAGAMSPPGLLLDGEVKLDKSRFASSSPTI